jgi:hypothetical protein
MEVTSKMTITLGRERAIRGSFLGTILEKSRQVVEKNLK